ncbi:MAG: TGS domain-containing protein [Candidatus Aenigmarchaeota archaeon]|nr:TGS domain-containing protein [Candidatus Aenigmarchaeota archaeon]
MPVNAPPEYFKAEEKFHSAKTKEEKITALEEMLRLMPRHHGSENALAQLKSRLAKLRKESTGKKGGRTVAIMKEGDAQVCFIGFTNSGKSWLLSRLTGAKPEIASHPYTTTKPQIGMMDYKGVKIQLVEIPSTFEPKYMSIARTADAIILIARHEKEEKDLKKLLSDNFIRTKFTIANPFDEDVSHIKEKIWYLLGFIIVYCKKTQADRRAEHVGGTPMALKSGATIRDFAQRIHKDFVKDFRYARVLRKGRMTQAGLDYKLQENDVVELYMK